MNLPQVFWRHSLGRRLILYILLFSSVVTLIGTAVQLHYEYRRDLSSIHSNIRQIEVSYLNSLGEGLWSFNERMLLVQLSGILDLPDLQYAEIRRPGASPLQAGQYRAGRNLEREFTLSHHHRGRQIELGTLFVVVGLEQVYARLRDRVLVILATQAVKTFFVSTFIFFLFYFLVGRPLAELAAQARSLNFSRLDHPLVPQRRLAGSERDEIGMVGQALEEMRQALLAEKQQQEKMTVQLRQAQKMEAIGTLAGGIAHDFNNILTPIIGYCELAQMQLTPAEQERVQVAEILKAAHRARDLVQQFLTFSRRQESDERSPLDLQPMIKENLKLLQGSLPAGIEVRHDLDRDCGPVLADLTGMQQVISQLCTNGVQAMSETGGVLEVGLKQVVVKAEEEPGELEPLPPGGYASLSVRDTGPGIAAQVRERIFDPYFTTKEQGKGSGLGLAVVHGIVKDHGGLITVTSELGQGAEFRVYLPLAQ